MPFLDLLTQAAPTRDAFLTPGGIDVRAPWAEVRLQHCAIAPGWYTLSAGRGDAIVTLVCRDAFEIIELSVRHDAPARVRLRGGDYDIAIMSGARPGFYTLENLRLEPMSFLTRARLLGGRAAEALRTGNSIPALLRQFRHIRRQRASFGFRDAPETKQKNDPFALKAPDDERFAQRVEALRGQPVIRVVCTQGPIVGVNHATFGLNDQIWPYWHDSLDIDCDLVVTVSPGDKLRPDALLLFAESHVAAPETERHLADVASSAGVTTRIAYDPLLYDAAPPTPFAERPDATYRKPDGRPAYRVISCPLADQEDAQTQTHTPFAAPDGLATVIIPSRDRADLLAKALSGLFEATTALHEVVVVDNGSHERAVFDLYDAYADKGLKVITHDAPFNFSTLCNLGAREASGEFLVFMNNDIVLHDREWLTHMTALADQPAIGAVGARLLYANGCLQHGGVALGMSEFAGHMWRGLNPMEQARIAQLQRTSLRSAVTAALMCVRRDRFEAVGGFDESRFPVTLNDVDLCLRLTERGWLSAYCAEATATHLEGVSRGADADPVKYARRLTELRAFAERWPQAWEADPFLSASLSRSGESCALR